MTTLYGVHEAPVDWNDLSTMKHMTCSKHPTAKYLTKNPWVRTLHFVAPAEEAPFDDGGLECPCPFGDLRVVIEEEAS